MQERLLSEIWIYPVKSLGGISLTRARVEAKGLLYDRRWMLVDSHHRFMTQRQYPAMALFSIDWHADEFTISFRHRTGPGSTATLDVCIPPEGPVFQANIWNDVVEVREVRHDLSEWFSSCIGKPCRLVNFPEENPRPVDPQYQYDHDHVSLADGFPFLIIGQQSLDDLNSRLAEPVPMNRFRPNFVFTHGAPYEEDGWREVTIGDGRFRAVKKSARCALITIDQETSVKGVEPLQTLAGYRQTDHKVYFGQNLVALNHTTVSLGDVLRATEA